MTHAEHTPGRTDCPGNLTVTKHLNRRSGVFTVYRCDQCGWTNDPRRRQQQTDRPKPVRIGATMKTMRLSLNRKAGAPNFGSDGAGMELEIELSDDTGMSGLPEIALTYYAMMEHTLQLQLERMAARHTEPAPARQVEPAAAEPPRRRQPEPTADDYDPEPPRREAPPEPPRRNDRRPEPRNGGNGPTRSGEGRGKPKSGRELIGWANGQGKYEELLAIANRIKRGRIVDWDQDLVDWAYNDLSRPVGAGWGDGRN